ncbi:hypothetical protein R1sor_002800 [Riccia sorocarpa]|uniref:Uncharacterized protein n=1 Tax=Riccia sorocarpa TaxID=122646 RepID=A0ABD3H068_9MARC
MLARDEIFVGAASARKLADFVPMIDIGNGLMLLIRPSDDFECQDCLWVGKATRTVCKDQEDTNYNKVPIQWWRPKHASSKASITYRYSQCIQRDVAWEVDPAYSGSYWISADSCVYAWKSRAKANKEMKGRRKARVYARPPLPNAQLTPKQPGIAVYSPAYRPAEHGTGITEDSPGYFPLPSSGNFPLPRGIWEESPFYRVPREIWDGSPEYMPGPSP